MPQNRQLDAGAIAVRTLALRLPDGFRIAEHRHDWGQIVYATDGVMTVRTGSASWVVPPQRAAWIPPGFVHSVTTTGRVRLRTLYIRPDLADLPRHCRVLHVTPLFRELILETIRREMLRDDHPAQFRLASVLVDQFTASDAAPLELRLPRDTRARVVADRVEPELADVPPLTTLARGTGASARTIERLFVRETGLSFGRWVQHRKALFALERIAAGDSVTQAGLAVGYDSTSAFIAMFKRVLGATPGSYFANRAPVPHRPAKNEKR